MNYERYKEIISAKDKTWKSEARKLMENGIEFIVIHLAQEILVLPQHYDRSLIM